MLRTRAVRLLITTVLLLSTGCLHKIPGQLQVADGEQQALAKDCLVLHELGPNVQTLIEGFNSDLASLMLAIESDSPDYADIDRREAILQSKSDQIRTKIDGRFANATHPAQARWQIRLDANDTVRVSANILALVVWGHLLTGLDQNILMSRQGRNIEVVWRRSISALEYCEFRQAMGALVSLTFATSPKSETQEFELFIPALKSNR